MPGCGTASSSRSQPSGRDALQSGENTICRVFHSWFFSCDERVGSVWCTFGSVWGVELVWVSSSGGGSSSSSSRRRRRRRTDDDNDDDDAIITTTGKQ